MGQAKQRGNLQERIKQAEERQDNFYGEVISVEEALKKLDLPSDAQPNGFVIHLPERDEFVGMINENNLAFSVAYVKTPDLAKNYEDVQV